MPLFIGTFSITTDMIILKIMFYTISLSLNQILNNEVAFVSQLTIDENICTDYL